MTTPWVISETAAAARDAAVLREFFPVIDEIMARNLSGPASLRLAEARGYPANEVSRLYAIWLRQKGQTR